MDRKMEIKNPATEQEKIKAEMEGFEPSHRLPGLPHFECGPFSHLGTSPDSKQNVLTMFHYIV